jgi:hypothetical protein
MHIMRSPPEKPLADGVACVFQIGKAMRMLTTEISLPCESCATTLLGDVRLPVHETHSVRSDNHDRGRYRALIRFSGRFIRSLIREASWIWPWVLESRPYCQRQALRSSLGRYASMVPRLKQDRTTSCVQDMPLG